MKKGFALITMLLVLLATTVGCGSTKAVEVPATEKVKADVQEYITELIDKAAVITYFQEADSQTDENEYKVTCTVSYSSEETEYRDEFIVTYQKKDSAWELSKCRVNSAYSGKMEHSLKEGNISVSQEAEITNTPEPTPEVTPEPTPEVTPEPTPELTPEPTQTVEKKLSLSDDLGDFTFELEGVVYQLPVAYEDIAAAGWKPDGFSEEDEMWGYSTTYCHLTNGKVRIEACIINLCGHVRTVKECTIGSIEIEVSNNLDFKIAKGVEGTVTRDEILEMYGIPSSNDTYTSSEYITYNFGTNKYVKFYLNYDRPYNNSILLKNYAETENDITIISEERPDYLEEYVAPTELGEDAQSVVFELDEVLYQLPCPLSEFTDNGWKISSSNVKSVGAGNYSYCGNLTLKKDGYEISLGLINYGRKEVYIQNCAVYAVEFSTYNLENAPEDYVKIPCGITLYSDEEIIKAVYKDFTVYESGSAVSYSYNDQDYVKEVYYYMSKDSRYINLENKYWAYE